MNWLGYKKKTKKTIYLHIGFMKTGTTSIQSSLINHAERLKDHNFYFPELNIQMMNYLGFCLLDEIPPLIHTKSSLNANQVYKRLKHEINKSNMDNIVLSAESFSLVSTDLFMGAAAPKKLLELLQEEHYRFKIIVLVRRQDDYLESQYNQHVKLHNFWDYYSKDIMSFYNEKKDLFNYGHNIDHWVRVFGKDAITVIPYHKGQNVLKPFYECLGFDLNTKEIAMSANSSLSPKAIGFMRYANAKGIDKSTAEKNYELIEMLSKIFPNKDGNKVLDKENASKVLDDYDASNKALSDKYLEGDYSWFSESNDIYSANPNNELTKEEISKIAIQFWNRFHKR